jgi:hypothetical protein
MAVGAGATWVTVGAGALVAAGSGTGAVGGSVGGTLLHPIIRKTAIATTVRSFTALFISHLQALIKTIR